MKTAEELANLAWQLWSDNADLNIRSAFAEAAKEVIAEITRARADAHLARCERADHEQEFPDFWAQVRAAAVEEVRGQAIELLHEIAQEIESADRPLDGVDSSLIYRLGGVAADLLRLGPSRPPLSPTEAEAGLRELLAWVAQWEDNGVVGVSTPLPVRVLVARIRKILGEG